MPKTLARADAVVNWLFGLSLKRMSTTPVRLGPGSTTDARALTLVLGLPSFRTAIERLLTRPRTLTVDLARSRLRLTRRLKRSRRSARLVRSVNSGFASGLRPRKSSA